ncbi:hypothetical protein PPTG_23989 [Phytophthora nicotianae INRA-310]|uniref:Ubiquitin-like protease family profile domain-containing protein n=1 Tax=Phytophthora nicotianae (strain INRA-310) TaxID=761204 RepID=W2PM37_PHYN3|nr:hypothetical protein PPTG_23989 [Phytophthora nicotianae INRA-310]ETN01922.1 hypothetical protein PPTG_23989 [Phytophthora nicotianae INRA-310]
MVKLFCAVVGAAGSAFSVGVDESDTVDDLKKAIRAEPEFGYPNSKMNLFLAKRGDAWLTENEVKGVSDTSSLTHLDVARAEISVVGLSEKDVRHQVDKHQVAAGNGPVNVMVVVVPTEEVVVPALSQQSFFWKLVLKISKVRRKSRRSKRHRDSEAEQSDASAAYSGSQSSDDSLRDDPAPLSIRVPELDVKLFGSWEELDKYLANYNRKMYQLYSVRTATPVKTRNERIKKSRTPCKTIPEELEFYNKTFVCTHHGSPRRSRSTGKRPKQHSRKIGCPAQRTGDRFEALRKYMHADLVPLLPEPPSPKRYKSKQLEWMAQVDSYNCGVFVITFFEMLLLNVTVTGSDSPSESAIAMHYFRYRFLDHILSSM